MGEKETKGISIIIPTLNGGSKFFMCLERIPQQDYSGEVQLTVMDSGSTDGAYEPPASGVPSGPGTDRKTSPFPGVQKGQGPAKGHVLNR